MIRAGTVLALFLALAAWAGAQAPTPAPALSAAERVKLHKANKVLIRHLVRGGADLAKADDEIERARACQKTAEQIAVWMDRAAREGDTERVLELGEHLEVVVRDGLIPNLVAARKPADVPGSPSEVARSGVQTAALGDLDRVENDLSVPGVISDNEKIRGLRERLAALRDRMR